MRTKKPFWLQAVHGVSAGPFAWRLPVLETRFTSTTLRRLKLLVHDYIGLAIQLAIDEIKDTYEELERHPPRADAAVPEVPAGYLEISVRAAGLNFRDVMYAMGLLSDEAVEAGFAAILIASPVAGLRPRRALRAGFLTRRIFTPVSGIVNSPEPRRFMCASIISPRLLNTAPTSFFDSSVDSAMAAMICVLVCFVVMAFTAGAAAAAFVATFFFAAFFLATMLISQF